MIKVLLIEDEPLAAKKLRRLLSTAPGEYTSLEEIDSIEEGVEWLKNNETPDLIISDIQLSDGLSFDIFDQQAPECPIIFTTAYDEYAIKAFKLNSIDYLLKPFSQEELNKALEKFMQLYQQSKPTPAIDITALQAALKQIKNQYKSRFVIKIGDKLISRNVEQVQAFISEDKYSFLIDEQGNKFIIQYSLEQLDKMLDPESFFRINRKAIVSLESIKEVIAYSGSRLKVILSAFNQTELIVSREKVGQFKLWLEA